MERPPAVGTLIGAVNVDFGDTSLHAAYRGCGGDAPSVNDAAFEQRVVELTNVERAKAGLPPLKSNSTLADAARYHSIDMAQDDYFQHDTHDRNGDVLSRVCAWHERVRSFVPDGAAMGENLAWGYDSPQAAVDAWMESQGHRENILRSSYSEMGAGYYDSRWGQEFASRDNVYPVIINGEASVTASANITLYAYGDWQSMRLRNDDGAWSEWRAFKNEIDWRINAIPGKRQVELELRDGDQRLTSSDSIEYIGPAQQQQPIVPSRFNQQIYIPLIMFR